MTSPDPNLLKMLGISPELAERFNEQFASDPDRAQEWLNDVMRDAMSHSSVELAEKLKRDAPSRLNQHGAEKASFERRLQQTGKKAFDLYDIVLTACCEAGADLNGRYRPSAAAQQDFVFEALTLVHGRACLIARGSRVARFGLPQWSTRALAALHELAVFTFLLPNAGPNIAERFLRHEYAESLKDAEVYQRYCQRLGETPFTDDEMRIMRERVNELKTKVWRRVYDRLGWAAPLIPQLKGAPSFTDLENVASLSHLRPYNRWASKAVHFGSKAVASGRVNRGPETPFADRADQPRPCRSRAKHFDFARPSDSDVRALRLEAITRFKVSRYATCTHGSL